MKLSVCLMLAVVAATSADQGFYQPQPVAQTGPDTYSNYNNYYDYQQPKKQGWLDRLFGSNRRQGLGDIFGGLFGGAGGLGGLGVLGPIGLVVAAILGLVAVAALYYVATDNNSSGRGLNSDEWEVDHSVWMDQLKNDFEDSWSVQ